MWFKEYRDYPIDRPLKREQVASGKGIIGCEMHDLNGWGLELHHIKSRKKSLWSKTVLFLFGKSQHE